MTEESTHHSPVRNGTPHVPTVRFGVPQHYTQHVQGVLALGEGEGAIGAVPGDFYTKEERCGAKLADLEVFLELLLHLSYGILGLRGESEVIDEN